MKGVLVVAHGSREKETEVFLKELLDKTLKNISDIHVEHGFMEFGERNIEQGIKALIEKGVTEIKVVPYFLFMGVHLKEDIPNIIKECMKKYPEVKVAIDEPLGADSRLAEILADRIRG